MGNSIVKNFKRVFSQSGGGGGLSGSGTLNYIPKWTPDGFTLGNSQIFDDGTNVGIGTATPNAKLVVYSSATNYATFGGQRPEIVGGHSENRFILNEGNLGESRIGGQTSANLVYGVNIYTARVSVAGFGLVHTYNFSDYLFNSVSSGGINKFTINHAGFSGNNRLGVGVDPTATGHFKGSDSTFNNFAAKFDNSSSAPLLHIRNDGKVGIKNGNLNYTLDVSGITGAGDGIITSRVAGSNFLAGLQNDLASGGYLTLYDGATNIKVILNSPTYGGYDRINTGLSFSVGNLGSAIAKLQVKADNSASDGIIFLFQAQGGENVMFGRNDGYVVKSAKNSPLSNSQLIASQMTSYINEGTNELIFKVKYSDGTTVKTGSIALV